MISVVSASKSFKQPKKVVKALSNVSLLIPKGEIYGLIGVNGSGKTTLAKILATLLIQDSGKVSIDDVPVNKYPNKIKQMIGISLGESRSFYYRLSAEQNLEFFGTMLEIPPKLLKKRIDELINLFNLTESKKTPYMEFSMGMKRKLDLARAMLTYPEVYLLDEPTNGIDPLSQDRIRNAIHELKIKGKTIFLITHNLYEANTLCDRVGILDQGKLLWQGATKDFDDFKETFILELTITRLVQDEEMKELKSLPIVKKIIQLREAHDKKHLLKVFIAKKGLGLDFILEKIASKNVGITNIHFLTPTIEDIFREFVKGEEK
jgi:ABC-2 type transport system ATP-binding protein